MKWLLWKLGIIDLVIIHLGSVLKSHKRIVRTRSNGTKYCYGYTFSTVYELESNNKLGHYYTWEEYKGINIKSCLQRPEWLKVKPKKTKASLEKLKQYVDNPPKLKSIKENVPNYKTHGWMEE